VTRPSRDAICRSARNDNNSYLNCHPQSVGVPCRSVDWRINCLFCYRIIIAIYYCSGRIRGAKKYSAKALEVPLHLA